MWRPSLLFHGKKMFKKGRKKLLRQEPVLCYTAGRKGGKKEGGKKAKRKQEKRNEPQRVSPERSRTLGRVASSAARPRKEI